MRLTEEQVKNLITKKSMNEPLYIGVAGDLLDTIKAQQQEIQQLQGTVCKLLQMYDGWDYRYNNKLSLQDCMNIHREALAAIEGAGK